jgi:hypothetical protein
MLIYFKDFCATDHFIHPRFIPGLISYGRFKHSTVSQNFTVLLLGLCFAKNFDFSNFIGFDFTRFNFCSWATSDDQLVSCSRLAGMARSNGHTSKLLSRFLRHTTMFYQPHHFSYACLAGQAYSRLASIYTYSPHFYSGDFSWKFQFLSKDL